MRPIQGLHHITAVATNPQTNIDFYQHILGQRLIKTTVNFDDPGVYHLYYADLTGTPGTVLTFFPWTHMGRGRVGAGETGALAYSIHPDSMSFWRDHLTHHGIAVEEATRFGSPMLSFNDPDGMALELIADENQTTFMVWEEGPIPGQHVLRGFHGVTLWLDEIEPSAQLLTGQLGYTFTGQEGMRYRYQSEAQDIGLYVDLLHKPGIAPGRFRGGSIHHIAFRTYDDIEQLQYLAKLRQAGQRVTPVQDRQYFKSIYFREPGGVLFEIATDGPGFLFDESVEELGSSLKLPPWYEPNRAEIERNLPPIQLKPVVKTEVSFA